jgi:regulator of protease activity HflC (stomatin/prohibitin superfamily)
MSSAPLPAAPTIATPHGHVRERVTNGLDGWLMFAVAVATVLVGFALVLLGAGLDNGALAAPGVLVIIVGAVIAAGLTAVNPGQARVLQLLGRYKGTVRTDGLRWVNPFTQRARISTRIRNHETDLAKVNDADGNPIEIAAVVVWQVQDTAKARFEVDDFVRFVGIQTETAVRHIATSYPYDASGEQKSLRESTDEITGQLSAEIAERVASAGVRVIESRITRLSYAPEIAGAMLRRQQASAVVAARSRIVEGAVGMVKLALEGLSEHGIVELDEERKAAMVSNLLVVLCADRDAQPIVNTSSLYH